jgi:large subunit ribosomal protein L21
MKKNSVNTAGKKAEKKNKNVNTQENSIESFLERYAIIKTGGKQYFAVEGQTLAVEKLKANPGEEVVFDEVLLQRTNKNECRIGQPFLDTPVKALVVKHIRGNKIIVFKFKRRKKYRTKKGHRQPLTVVRFISIS